MDERICKCGHLIGKHEWLDQSIEDMIGGLVKAGTLIPQYHPDKVAATGFFMKGDESHLLPYTQIVEVLTNIRATRSKCKHDVMFGCHCEVFMADNLAYLEKLSERATSKIIH
jgi:hypothetical protein